MGEASTDAGALTDPAGADNGPLGGDPADSPGHTRCWPPCMPTRQEKSPLRQKLFPEAAWGACPVPGPGGEMVPQALFLTQHPWWGREERGGAVERQAPAPPAPKRLGDRLPLRWGLGPEGKEERA